MHIVDHNLAGDPHALATDLLARPVFCFVGMTAVDGDAPRVSPLWFLWEDDALWILGDTEETHTARLEHDPRVAVAIVDFDAGDRPPPASRAPRGGEHRALRWRPRLPAASPVPR